LKDRRPSNEIRNREGTASERVPSGDNGEAVSEREVGLEASTGYGSGLYWPQVPPLARFALRAFSGLSVVAVYATAKPLVSAPAFRSSRLSLPLIR